MIDALGTKWAISPMKNEHWNFLAETKEAAIGLLTKQQKVGWGTMSAKDYSCLIKTIEGLDLTMSEPSLAQDEVIADGVRWIIRVSYAHEEWDCHYLHEFSAVREVIVYGLYRKIE